MLLERGSPVSIRHCQCELSTYTLKDSKVEIESPVLIQVRERVGSGLEEGGGEGALSREVQDIIPQESPLG